MSYAIICEALAANLVEHGDWAHGDGAGLVFGPFESLDDARYARDEIIPSQRCERRHYIVRLERP